jgi:membrane-bound ClpP family serine protease
MTTSRTSADTALRVGIVLLTLATALIHLQLAFPDPAFILNGLGYLTLLAALYMPVQRLARYRNVVRWVLIGFTALTILLWILLGARTPIGYADKAIEDVLILLLLLEARRSD